MDNILQYLDLLNKYSSLILVVATSVYVGFTIVLAKETRKLREVETSPFLSIVFDTTYVSKFKLIIKNIGKAPAYNITFEIDKKYLGYFQYGFNNKISYFAPDQEFSSICSGYKDLSESGYKSIPIKVVYYSKDGQRILDTFSMEWEHLDGTLLEKEPLNEIKKSLDNITQEMKSVNKSINDKHYFITKKLSLLKLKVEDEYVTFIFSNGQIFELSKNTVIKIGIEDVEQIYIENGNILDLSNGQRLIAEELLNKIKSEIKETSD